MKRFYNTILFLFFAIIIGLAYNQWIFHWGILTYGDWYFFHNETLTTIRLSSFHLWVSDFSLGSVNIGLGQAPTYALYGAFAVLFGWGFAVSSRLIHLLPIVIFTPLLSYLLLWKLTKNKIASLVGALIYSFNTYFLILDAGTVTLMAAYVFFPGIFLLYYKTIESFCLRYAVATTLLLGISSAYEPRVFYIILWVLFLYLLFILFISLKKSKKYILKIAVYGIIPIFLGLLLNFYWLYGLAHTHSLTSNVLFSRSLFGDEFLNMLYAITLYHPFWSDSAPAIFINQKIPFFVWIIPVGAFLGVYLNRKNSIVSFFGMLALLGVFLTKQSAYPFEGVFLWLYTHLPGFNAFREATKFYGIIAFAYSILIAFLIRWFWEQKWKTMIRKYIPIVVSAIFAGVFLINLKPLVTGDIQTLFVERHIPNDYSIVKNLVVADKGYYRTLWIPTYSRWGILTTLHPELSLVELSNSTWLTYASQNTPDGKYTEAELLAMLIHKNNFQQLVQQSNVKYIFIPLEDKENEDDFFVFYGKPKQYYSTLLDSISWLKKVNIGTKEIGVYKNLLYKPHIYETEQKETTAKNISYKNMQFSSVNQTEYVITLNHVKMPFYMNFSESYDQNWKLHVGSFNWLTSITTENYFEPSIFHSITDAGLNSFYINPAQVCSSIIKGCIKNSDGTYTIYVTLYYSPEAYFDIGLIVSGATFALIIVYLMFWGISSVIGKYEKSNK